MYCLANYVDPVVESEVGTHAQGSSLGACCIYLVFALIGEYIDSVVEPEVCAHTMIEPGFRVSL